MVKANCDTARFQYVTQQLQINPENKEELQKIRYFPEAISLLKETNAQYQKIDDLGYQFMPSDAYEKWLGSLKGEKSKQDDESLRKQFKGIIIKKTKG